MSVALAPASVETLASIPAPPVTLPEDSLFEVVDGRIFEKIMGSRELEIAAILGYYLDTFVRANKLGRVLPEFLFRIDLKKDLQRRPDVAFVSSAKWPVRQ